jgi:hypothetical protein
VGQLLPSDAIGSPGRWLIVFSLKAKTWWTSLVAFGRYKHVRCFGYVAAVDAYLFYDVQFGGTTLQLARGEPARRLMLEWCWDADVLAIGTPTNSDKLRQRWFTPLLCTTAVAHLIGLECVATLRPDAFYRACLRAGAVPIGRTQSTDPACRPDAAAAYEDCASAAGAGASD